MEVPIYTGGATERIEVDHSFLGDKVKTRTLKAAVLMYRANKRVGTHSTLTRGEVSRSKKAAFRQKGLGRGRVRHPQVVQCKGGGVAHGPKPRDYSYRMPRKALRVALKSALLSKFRDGEVVLVDQFDLPAPRTKDVRKVLEALGCSRTALVVTREQDPTLLLSARNLRQVQVATVRNLNAYDVIRCRNLVLTKDALEALKEVHADE